MKKLLALSAAVLASLVLYLAVFAIVQRPLTLGDLVKQLDFKLAYAKSIKGPKVMVLAGSNGRYSHSCEVISQTLGRPCVNAAIAAGIGLDFLLTQFDAVLEPGDLVYMPLEYEQYTASAEDMHRGAQNAVLARSRGADYLRSLSLARLAEVFSAYDLPFLIRGGFEMALAHHGFKRRTGIDTLDEQGDEQGHTAQKALTYREFVMHEPTPQAAVVPSPDALAALSAFLRRQNEKHVAVVGGLPTVPSDTAIEAADVERIRNLFTSAGQHFVVAPNLARYPRSCFFDAVYHLDEECQKRHSAAVASLLQPLLPPLH